MPRLFSMPSHRHVSAARRVARAGVGRSARCASAVALTAAFALAPSLASAEVCSPFTAELVSIISPGVAWHDCSNTDPKVHVVTINRALPDVQLRILADADGEDFTLQELDDLADDAGALVAINGFFWGGDEGFLCAWPLSCAGTPTTSVFIDGQRRTSLSEFETESLLGFADVGNEGIDLRLIPGTQIDSAENAAYRRWAYGAARLMQNGIFSPPPEDPSYRQSLMGYSPDEVVMLVSDGEYTLAQLRTTLEAFGVTEAVLNDAGRSARMVLRGDVNEDLKHGPFPTGDRNIAYGIGLVRVGSSTRCKSLLDGAGNRFGTLCVTPSSNGYDAKLTVDGDGPDRCGAFRFSLQPTNGDLVLDQGAFDTCTSTPREWTYAFNTGVLGGCANVNLDQVSGDDFGETHWWVSPCGDPSGDPGGSGGGEISATVRGLVVHLSAELDDPESAVEWSYALGEGTDPDATCTLAAPTSLETTLTCDRPGTYVVTLTIAGQTTITTTVRIENQAPRLHIESPRPWQLFDVDTPVALVAPIDDTPGDSHTCSVEWDDGSAEQFAAVGGSCSRAHDYEHAGMYTVRVAVEDSFGASDAAEVLVVVYDPSAGANNSDGSYLAPAGTFEADPARAGEAWFHLAARYFPAQRTRPEGNAQAWLSGTPFRFDSGSTGIDWLVVTPDGKIAAKGSGTLQGRSGSYGFVFYGYHGCGNQSAPGCQPGPDRFRVVVWDLAANPNPGYGTIFDSAPDSSFDLDAAAPTPLQSGIVTIHPE